jgi:1-deoxy-D-xylulose-5-phosphate reductoisomerase
MSGAKQRKRIAILGSTGSVGVNTLDLVERHPERYDVVALTAHSNYQALAAQAMRLNPEVVAIADRQSYHDLKAALAGTTIRVLAGDEGIVEAAAEPADWTMSAIVGAAGLKPTLTAIRQGGTVALANKECLVCAGPVMMRAVAASGATLLPVDSEHNAIFQVFDSTNRDRIEQIILTASGGPFRDLSIAEMRLKTPAQAVAHPNWSMGAKISVDSATMMNKGQSIIHSMVAYVDGSVLAQLGAPDMRTPIAYCLAWPDRMPAPSERLDLARIGQLDFSAPDVSRFPCLQLARAALIGGQAMTICLNAANEVAVAAFLAGKTGFCDIAEVVETVIAAATAWDCETVDQIIEIDQWARTAATIAIDGLGSAKLASGDDD